MCSGCRGGRKLGRVGSYGGLRAVYLTPCMKVRVAIFLNGALSIDEDIIRYVYYQWRLISIIGSDLPTTHSDTKNKGTHSENGQDMIWLLVTV